MSEAFWMLSTGIALLAGPTLVGLGLGLLAWWLTPLPWWSILVGGILGFLVSLVVAANIG